ncbi:MAG: glycerophosphodiester phosphodiesterase [Bdellovibrionaceae bacterium]|nr:glycerophosphodiester phosphodiesterase [Pseudobdellovibrionaceae bacterium]
MMLKEPKFQTHRGNRTLGAMENTLEALETAREHGSKMVEFDVRLTRDFIPVVYHDDTLARLHKARLAVNRLSLEQMRVFAPNVTTFEEVLRSRKVPLNLNVELKTDSALDPALEIQVAKLVKKYKAEERVVFSSFNPFSLIRARGLAPEVARALLVTEDDEKKNYWFLKHMSLLPLCEAQFLHWDEKMCTADRVDKFLNHGYQLAAYTVNDPSRARELFALGVGSVISDTLLAV